MTPKKDLVGRLAVMLEQGELRVAARLGEREALERELLGMWTRPSVDGRESYEGEHDDLVMAAALACWRARGQGVCGEQGRSLGLY